MPECKECARLRRGTNKRANRNDPVEINGVLSKACTRCGDVKPATEKFFPYFKQGKNGFHPWCRTCINQYELARSLASGRVQKHRDKPKEIDGVLHRKCRTCGTWLPATTENFTPQKGCSLGLRPNCRECARQRSVLYGEQHKQESVERAKLWIKVNTECHRQHSLAVKARRRQAEGQFTADDIVEKLIRQDGSSFYCGCILENTYEIDHYIPLARGGTHHPTNIVIACKACNRQKAAKDPEKFIASLREKTEP